jgi:ubiquinone/menaquinone biosynthesis C-methylase UbiE
MNKDYYNKFSIVYDILSPKIYYHKARNAAVSSLDLEEGQTVLNVPVGTGQNLAYLQRYLHDTGQIIGVDLSEGMLSKAFQKINTHDYSNVTLQNMDVADLNAAWLTKHQTENPDMQIDAVLCDLGLSGFESWKKVIENLLTILKPGGKLVVMDWELKEPSLRGELVKWIGGGEVERPIPAYLQNRLASYEIDHSFNRGGVFVASGVKQIGIGS